MKTSPGGRADPFSGYRSNKDAQSEKASAGYYSVLLTTYGVRAELTATAHCGFHRYTFPSSRQANILIDLANSRPAVSNASVHVISNHIIEGFQTSGTETVFFHAEFIKIFSSSGTWKSGILMKGSSEVSGTLLGAYVTFNTSAKEANLVIVGTSTKSLADAAANLKREIPPATDFEAIRRRSRTLWSQGTMSTCRKRGTLSGLPF